MSSKEHRFGVSEVNLVKRSLKIETSQRESIHIAIEEIDKLFGMDEASFDEKAYVIKMSYDASRLCIDGIEDILKKHGVSVNDDWWTHFKEGFYRFVDENVKNNSEHEPWSCHKTPPNSPK